MRKSLTAEALDLYWPTEWYTNTSAPKYGLKDWIKLKKFQINSSPFADASFTLNFSKEHSPLLSLGYDCNKFSSASIETLKSASLSTSNVIKNSTAWLAIKNYYAAFYAAHALLRLNGRSCTQIETQEVRSLNEILNLFHQTAPPIKGGYYSVTVDEKNNTISFVKSTVRPHMQLWTDFNNFISSAISGLQTGTTRYQSVMMKLQSLQNNLTFKNNHEGNWLSQIRDEINYKHTHSAWFPYTGVKKANVEKIIQLVKKRQPDSLNINLDTYSKDEDLIRFFATTTYLVEVCCEVIEYMQAVNLSTFPKHQPVKLLKMLNA